MMVITDEQMKILSEWIRKKFELRAVAHLREHHAGRTKESNDNLLLAVVRKGIGNAAKYGIDEEDDVLRFLDYMMVCGMEFDTDARFPWAQEILNDTKYPASSKMTRLDNREYALLEVEE